METFWFKVIRDIRQHAIRSIVIVLAIAVAVTVIGATLGMNAVLRRELNRLYVATNPADIVIQVQPLFDRSLIKRVTRMNGVAQVDGRLRVSARAQDSASQWHTLILIELWLEALGADYLDQRDVLTPADEVQPAKKQTLRCRTRAARPVGQGIENLLSIPL